jgi:hypothetical protein
MSEEVLEQKEMKMRNQHTILDAVDSESVKGDDHWWLLPVAKKQ